MHISKKQIKVAKEKEFDQNFAKDDDITENYDINEEDLPGNLEIEVVEASEPNRGRKKIAGTKNYLYALGFAD